ncbi:hypothetical protein DSM106972_036370 [Dulcicalothrix desertica PCC 7102]|uniref:Uncharacterized protein n=1 Tax=Dulcicalothrix desertica PCC 7102 TaxID=232991 RepID=A0A3S1J0M7_9CYAN|nr:hypothetical protein [Dulcicalothrix desertica]RUT05630.1 hypothetical protein DSM106972_036370 [Dulcicalothrix desertica PCC 7102]TWH54727.1 hypothetical protein CAL7102_02780 [Dulcicalothrix desertica PCC 7102]
MKSEKLQQLQSENYLTIPQISEGNNEQELEGRELMEAKSSELHSEQIQEVLQESIKPEINSKSNQCITIKPCPTTGSPQGCLVCF